MKKRLQDILHKYKVEAFKVAHDHESVAAGKLWQAE